jgi:hypothetical protein
MVIRDPGYLNGAYGTAIAFKVSNFIAVGGLDGRARLLDFEVLLQQESDLLPLDLLLCHGSFSNTIWSQGAGIERAHAFISCSR